MTRFCVHLPRHCHNVLIICRFKDRSGVADRLRGERISFTSSGFGPPKRPVQNYRPIPYLPHIVDSARTLRFGKMIIFATGVNYFVSLRMENTVFYTIGEGSMCQATPSQSLRVNWHAEEFFFLPLSRRDFLRMYPKRLLKNRGGRRSW